MVESTARRPVVAIPARFSAGASALRSRAEVAARALVEAVWAAGGEPLVVHPHAPAASLDVAAVRRRLWMADAVLLPGGGDLAPRWSGQRPHPSLYDVDEEQDAFDLALAEVALTDGLPLLAICRGQHVVNVALGGDLVQDMDEGPGHHRHRRHDVAVTDDGLAALVGRSPSVSCHHHQCAGRLGEGLAVAALAADGTVEAVVRPGGPGWFLGLQWHPEDLAAHDPAQAAVFAALVRAAAQQAVLRGG